MPKRHHSGMKHAKHLGSAHYDGMDARRHQEHVDGQMLSEDHSAVANLPQGVVMKPFGRSEGYLPDGLNDGITGIDNQRGLDHRQMMRHYAPKKV